MSKNILIVDDEPSIRMVLRAHLERSGYAVTAAENGAEAIALLGKDTFHLVVSDLRMPVVDGMALVERVEHVLPALRMEHPDAERHLASAAVEPEAVRTFMESVWLGPAASLPARLDFRPRTPLLSDLSE